MPAHAPWVNPELDDTSAEPTDSPRRHDGQSSDVCVEDSSEEGRVATICEERVRVTINIFFFFFSFLALVDSV